MLSITQNNLAQLEKLSQIQKEASRKLAKLKEEAVANGKNISALDDILTAKTEEVEKVIRHYSDYITKCTKKSITVTNEILNLALQETQEIRISALKILEEPVVYCH